MNLTSAGTFHFPVQTHLAPPTQVQRFYTFFSDVLVNSELPSPQHVFDCSCKFIHFQQQQYFSSQLIQSADNLVLVFLCLCQYFFSVLAWFQVKHFSLRIIQLLLTVAHFVQSESALNFYVKQLTKLSKIPQINSNQSIIIFTVAAP